MTESRLNKLTEEILETANDSPHIIIDTLKGPEKKLIKKLILGYIEFLNENKFSHLDRQHNNLKG